MALCVSSQNYVCKGIEIFGVWTGSVSLFQGALFSEVAQATQEQGNAR